MSFSTGLIFAIIIWVFKMITGSREIGKSIQIVARIFPMYCFGSAIMTMTTRDIEMEVQGYDENLEIADVSVFEWKMGGADLFTLLI